MIDDADEPAATDEPPAAGPFPPPFVAEPLVAPEPAPESEPATLPPSAAGAIVATWVQTHLNGSPLARVTAAWNHLQAALPALVEALDKELGR